MSRRILIIGPSSSGKTTVAQAVARELNLPLISMDDFRARNTKWVPRFILHAGKKVRNYEDPSNWDANAVVCKLRAFMQEGQGFVAEGNHLLVYPQINAIAQTERYYLDVDFKTALARRIQRNRGTEADQAFAKIGQRLTAEIVEPQKLYPWVQVLDGTLSPYVIGSSIIHRDFHGEVLLSSPLGTMKLACGNYVATETPTTIRIAR